MATMRLHPRRPLGHLLHDASRSYMPPSRCHPCVRGLSLRSQSSEADRAQPPRRNNRTRASRKPRSPQWRNNQKLPLGVDALGNPGEIVVVAPVHRQNRTLGRDQQTGEESDRIALDTMLGDLDVEESGLTMSTVHSSIETYRSMNDKLAAAVWEETRRNLAASFTASQLSDYLASHQAGSSEEEDTSETWRPGTSLYWQTTPRKDLADRVSTSHDLKGKALLAERILRNCWKQSITDEIGQLDLRLHAPLITLLLHGDNFSLDQVATLHRASIDITHSLGLVRITGPESACESVREMILDAIARAQQMDVGFSLDPSRLELGSMLTPRFLGWLSETYGVGIEKGSSNLPEQILYFTGNKLGAEDARRTLHLAMSHAISAPIPFSTYFPASELAGIHKHQPDAYLSWFDQQRQWFRWSIPSMETTDSDSNLTPFFDGHQKLLSNELLKLLRGAPIRGVGLENNAEFGESVSAVVGKCLFAQKSMLPTANISASELGKISSSRTFTTDIPRLMPFLDSLSPIESASPRWPIHRLQLLPSITNSAVLPELEVLFALNPKATSEEPGDIKLHEVKLIFDTSHVDYLLPENGLDLRFTRRVYRTFKRAQSASAKFLMDSISESLHNALISRDAAKNPFPMAKFSTLELPSDLLLTTSSTAHDPSASGHEIAAEYLFPPLSDIRGANVQRYEFDGRELSCSFSNLGPFLPAQNTELCLNLELLAGSVPENRPSQTTLEPSFHSFYNSACKLAFGAHKARNSDLDYWRLASTLR